MSIKRKIFSAFQTETREKEASLLKTSAEWIIKLSQKKQQDSTSLGTMTLLEKLFPDKSTSTLLKMSPSVKVMVSSPPQRKENSGEQTSGRGSFATPERAQTSPPPEKEPIWVEQEWLGPDVRKPWGEEKWFGPNGSESGEENSYLYKEKEGKKAKEGETSLESDTHPKQQNVEQDRKENDFNPSLCEQVEELFLEEEGKTSLESETNLKQHDAEQEDREENGFDPSFREQVEELLPEKGSSPGGEEASPRKEPSVEKPNTEKENYVTGSQASPKVKRRSGGKEEWQVNESNTESDKKEVWGLTPPQKEEGDTSNLRYRSQSERTEAIFLVKRTSKKELTSCFDEWVIKNEEVGVEVEEEQERVELERVWREALKRENRGLALLTGEAIPSVKRAEREEEEGAKKEKSLEKSEEQALEKGEEQALEKGEEQALEKDEEQALEKDEEQALEKGEEQSPEKLEGWSREGKERLQEEWEAVWKRPWEETVEGGWSEKDETMEEEWALLDLDAELDRKRKEEAMREEDPNERARRLWLRCEDCGTILYKKHVLKENYKVCFTCASHLEMSSEERIESLVDPNSWEPINKQISPGDPLEFEDEKRYLNRLEESQERTGLQDAIQTGTAVIEGIPVALGVMDFQFMGGSMGSVVGEKITRLIEYALEEGLFLVLVCASGGARMQEGIFSLMQMAKISGALNIYKSCGNLLYISLLTSPTTGGVTASFAMLGDIIIAEPKAVIGFAGRRVIEQTLQEELPSNFQTAEYLHHHGLVDLIVHRFHLREAFSECIGFHQKAPLKEGNLVTYSSLSNGNSNLTNDENWNSNQTSNPDSDKTSNSIQTSTPTSDETSTPTSDETLNLNSDETSNSNETSNLDSDETSNSNETSNLDSDETSNLNSDETSSDETLNLNSHETSTPTSDETSTPISDETLNLNSDETSNSNRASNLDSDETLNSKETSHRRR